MKKHLFMTATAALFLCILAALTGCQKEPALTITGPTSIELGVAGGSGSFTFTANRDWSVNTSDNWVRVSPSSGSASKDPITVTVSCDPNNTYDDRFCTVTVTMGSLTQGVQVSQPANQGIIAPNRTFDVSSDGGDITVEVQANVAYSVSTDAGWIKMSATKALTSSKIKFSIEANPTFVERTGTITFRGGDLNETVVVKQAGKEKPTYTYGAEAVSLGIIIDTGKGKYELLFADRNLGAAKPEEYGAYFAWGETEPKFEFSAGNYKFRSADGHWTKYVLYETGGNTVDGKDVLEAADDAASVKLGDKWRMITESELIAIREAENSFLSWSETTKNGVKGAELKSSKTGKSVFFPYGGDYGTGSVNPNENATLGGVGTYFNCWSASLRVNDGAWSLGGSVSSGISKGETSRPLGLNIRPVTTLPVDEPSDVPEGAVDLGLSVYWATCNIGAPAPEELGDYYAWGETETKNEYTWNTYKWGKYDSLTKYGPGDKRTVLEAEDDVAHVKLGGKWRMPTDAEWAELLENCAWASSTLNDVNVKVVTSNKNGNSIFFPLPGYRLDTLYGEGSCGFYWSSSLSTEDPNDAWGAYLEFYDVSRRGLGRFYGYSVRPVCDK